MKLKFYLFLLLGLFLTLGAKGQDFAIKTNLLYDATTSMNLGFEAALSEKWTLDLSGNWNPWQFSENKKWKHWMAQPEVRYWTCHKFGGHFLALHLLGGQYNMGNIKNLPDFLGSNFSNLEKHRYEGWGAGAGIGYGYAWMLGKHWNLEVELGLGVIYTEYEKFYCPKCGEKIGTGDHLYYGPTKAAISLVYLF